MSLRKGTDRPGVKKATKSKKEGESRGLMGAEQSGEGKTASGAFEAPGQPPGT